MDELVHLTGHEGKVSTRNVNKQYEERVALSEDRADIASEWVLKKSFGGKYDYTDNKGKLPQFKTISYFVQAAKSSRSKKDIATIAKLAIMLGKYVGVDYPAMLFHTVNGIVVMNKPSKTKIRDAIRDSFNTTRQSYHVMTGGSSSGPSLVDTVSQGCGGSADDNTPIHHLVFDIPAFIRKCSAKANDKDTVNNVILMVIEEVCKLSLHIGVPMVTMCEDTGGCLQKLYTELIRDLTSKKTTPSTTPVSFEFKLDNELPTKLEAGFLGKRYSKRGKGEFRDQWKEAVYEMITKHPHKVVEVMKSGKIRFCGFGATLEQRAQMIEIDAAHPTQFQVIDELASENREDTNMYWAAKSSLLKQENVVIWVEDGDLPLISILNLNQEIVSTSNMGKLFVQMTKQDIVVGDETRVEKYLNCSQVVNDIIGHLGLNLLERHHRVPSIVTLMILLGGDTTSYLYLPYQKCLNWYLEYADFVGSLVREPTAEEKAKGFAMLVVDEEAVKRLMILLYSLYNKVVPGWKQYPHNEQTDILKGLTHFQVSQKVAKLNVPKIMRYVMSIENLMEHIKRANLRLHTWLHAGVGTVPDVPLDGFIYTFEKVAEPPVTISDLRYVRLDQMSRNGYEITKVEPSLFEVNTKHVDLWENGLSQEDIMSGVIRASNAVSKATTAQLKVLFEAHRRLQTNSNLTAPQKKEIMLAYYRLGDNDKFKLFKESIKEMRAEGISSEYETFIKSIIEESNGDEQLVNLLPWTEMGLGEGDGAVVERGGEENNPVPFEETELDNDEQEEENLAMDNILQQRLHENPVETQEVIDGVEAQEYSGINDMDFMESD